MGGMYNMHTNRNTILLFERRENKLTLDKDSPPWSTTASRCHRRRRRRWCERQGVRPVQASSSWNTATTNTTDTAASTSKFRRVDGSIDRCGVECQQALPIAILDGIEDGRGWGGGGGGGGGDGLSRRGRSHEMGERRGLHHDYGSIPILPRDIE